METFIVWTIQAYQEKTDDGTLIDVIYIKVIANSDNEALEKAKKLLDKPNYRIAEISEFKA